MSALRRLRGRLFQVVGSSYEIVFTQSYLDGQFEIVWPGHARSNDRIVLMATDCVRHDYKTRLLNNRVSAVWHKAANVNDEAENLDQTECFKKASIRSRSHAFV